MSGRRIRVTTDRPTELRATFFKPPSPCLAATAEGCLRDSSSGLRCIACLSTVTMRQTAVACAHTPGKYLVTLLRLLPPRAQLLLPAQELDSFLAAPGCEASRIWICLPCVMRSRSFPCRKRPAQRLLVFVEWLAIDARAWALLHASG